MTLSLVLPRPKRAVRCRKCRSWITDQALEKCRDVSSANLKSTPDADAIAELDRVIKVTLMTLDRDVKAFQATIRDTKKHLARILDALAEYRSTARARCGNRAE